MIRVKIDFQVFIKSKHFQVANVAKTLRRLADDLESHKTLEEADDMMVLDHLGNYVGRLEVIDTD